MLNTDFIDNLVKHLSDAIPPSMQAVKADLERNFRAILQSILAKFELVTREEFDVQVGVLAKTRAKLEALEQEILVLEKELAQVAGQTKK